jgi:hypothetical protein
VHYKVPRRDRRSYAVTDKRVLRARVVTDAATGIASNNAGPAIPLLNGGAPPSPSGTAFLDSSDHVDSGSLPPAARGSARTAPRPSIHAADNSVLPSWRWRPGARLQEMTKPHRRRFVQVREFAPGEKERYSRTLRTKIVTGTRKTRSPPRRSGCFRR